MLEACPLSCDVCSEAAALAAVRSRLLSRAGCTDRHEACAAWAARGDCARLDAVRAACAASCGSCGEASRAACDDIDAQCAGWAEVGECARNPEAMGRSCARSCGLCEGGGGEEEGKEGGEGAAAAVAAVLCLDSRPDCPGWALSGECGRNPAVPRACPKSCGRCAPHRTPTTREKSAPTASDSLPADSLPADGEASPSSRGEALLPLPARTPCKDEAEPDVCRSWAEAGECTRNLRSMHAACRKTQTHAAEDGHWSLESWSRLSVVTNLVLTCALLYVCVRKLGCRPCRRRRAAPPLASPPRRRAPSKGSARSAKGSPRGGGSGDEKATAASASTTMRYVVPLASLRGMPQADQLIGMIEPTEAHSAHSSREIDVPAACAATNQSDTAYRDSYIIKVGS
ncbi:hypothetical protein AB1Y20_011838 [Prymnesium parvum]|uniref:ShKT domain-containing protein n=1 Tax=Prymnesium parvum TaxID=97485 RepID=A0AB34IK95_PRYPA